MASKTARKSRTAARRPAATTASSKSRHQRRSTPDRSKRTRRPGRKPSRARAEATALTDEIDRNRGIGASEAAAACGLSPYEQTVELYLRKVGQLPAQDATEAMLFGRCIEAGGIEFWSRLNNIPVTYPLSTRRHPELPFLFATPDAQISPEEGLEFKSMSWQLAREIDELGLAAACPHYLLQAQQQMAVMGWRSVRLVGLVDRKLREWPIERNDRLIRLMIERETVFWEHVERRQPPAIDFTRPNCLRAVRHLFPMSTGTTIPLDAATSAQWADYERAGREIAELAEQRERCKAAVLLAIGEHGAGVLEGGERMVRRKLVQRTGYSVAPTEFWDVRAVACKGLPALVVAAVPDSGAQPGRSRRGREQLEANSRSRRKH